VPPDLPGRSPHGGGLSQVLSEPLCGLSVYVAAVHSWKSFQYGDEVHAASVCSIGDLKRV